MKKISNYNLKLIPSTEVGHRKIDFDFPELHIGTAQYSEGPTGCTVFYFPKTARFAADIRGGSPGVVLLGQWESGDQTLDAVCFTGGSVYGLESLCGVSSEIFAKRQYETDWRYLADVHGAVIYDYRPRDNAIYPDRELGSAAFLTAQSGTFPLGRVGAGSSASVGKMGDAKYWELAGQGGAFREIGQTKIAIFTVVNSVGAIVNREGNVVRGNFDKSNSRYLSPIDLAMQKSMISVGGNTTLSIMVTNQKLSSFSLRQIAKQVHTSMARSIQPFHAMTDGDVFFAVTTDEVENPDLMEVDLGVIASELAWDAVLSSFN